MADLTVRRLGTLFTTPVVLSSGPAGFGYELAEALDFRQIGAITTKTITLEPKTGNPQPRLVDCPSGALNSIGLENPGIAAFKRTVHPKIIELPLRRIVSLAASTYDDMSRLVAHIHALSGHDALELNLSCPNVGGQIPGADATEVEQFVRAAVAEATLPVLVKLPGDSGNLLRSCERALTAGAAGVTLINSVRGLRIDWSSGRPFLSREYGGLSGPAILPISLARVFEARRAFPEALIIGMGGVSDLGSALEMLMAGADFIGIGFGLMVDPQLPERLACALSGWLDQHDLSSVEDVIGIAHSGGFHVH
ncbi:dihydroorotate dehydrogenase [Candidatus Bipolaricaulota bacterium]|nr:dihydroorotate dehydrogenase [Candidatus Bipolaricaulota bacterium]